MPTKGAQTLPNARLGTFLAQESASADPELGLRDHAREIGPRQWQCPEIGPELQALIYLN